MALEVPDRLRPQIISTFGTTRVVGRQPYAPAAFTPGEFHITHFQRLSRPQGTWFSRKEPRKKSPVTPPGIDLRNVLNHYVTPGPETLKVSTQNVHSFIHIFPETLKVSTQNIQSFIHIFPETLKLSIQSIHSRTTERH